MSEYKIREGYIYAWTKFESKNYAEFTITYYT